MSVPKSKEQKRKQYIKEYRKQKRASESFHLSTQSPESKEQKRKKYIKEYRKQKLAGKSESHSIQTLVSQFHEAVSQGPLYVCTCCDQLWYKHSVAQASTLKKNNPDIQKILLNKVSVDNVEWLCQTCNKHLKNNKVPPCAIINGMQFPNKPLFFI